MAPEHCQRRLAGKQLVKTQPKHSVQKKLETHKNQHIRHSFARRTKPLTSLKRRREARAEATLEEVPLIAGGVPGPLAVSNRQIGWKPFLCDDFRRSFASYCPAPFGDAVLRKWWNQLSQELPWERPQVGDGLLPRSAAWLTLPGCSCTYAYTGTRWPSTPMSPWFLELTDEVCRVCGLKERPNACNANYYADGNQSVGWHSDDESLFAATRYDALIVSLSLGATRTFEVRPNGATSSQVKRIKLRNGDLLAMEGLMQKHFRHRIPRVKNASPRINLTWRWILNHEPNCEKSRSRTEQLLEECQNSQLALASIAPNLMAPIAKSSSEAGSVSELPCAPARLLLLPPPPFPTIAKASALPPPPPPPPPRSAIRHEECSSIKRVDVSNQSRKERTSASGMRLCLPRCFINPAACICEPLREKEGVDGHKVILSS